jgi:hypothetical protein
MRGLPNVSFILLDEADFFPPSQQQDARDVSERYIAKSNPYIVMVSTPKASIIANCFLGTKARKLGDDISRCLIIARTRINSKAIRNVLDLRRMLATKDNISYLCLSTVKILTCF